MEGEEELQQSAGGQNQSNHYINGDNYPVQPINSRRRETINSILIIVIGVFAIIFSIVGFLINVNNPFADILKQGAEADALAAKQQQAELLAMQTKDTDSDGLTDYDELNKYSTSPYLKDSDSDGVDDKSEILRGTDPNCPEGQQCAATAAASASDGAVPTLTTDSSASAMTITPSYIRGLMVQNGVSEAELSQISDTELMSEFAQYLKDNPDIASQLTQAGINVASVSQPAATTSEKLVQPDTSTVDLKALNVKSVNDLKNLNGAQIRQLMIQSGASASLLSSVSDDDLKTMFINQIESQAMGSQ